MLIGNISATSSSGHHRYHHLGRDLRQRQQALLQERVDEHLRMPHRDIEVILRVHDQQRCLQILQQDRMPACGLATS